MNGGHDLGGMHGLGPINPEKETEEPWFHDAWERRAFALTLACGGLGQWSIDEGRHARECQHPADYLKNSYYENWMVGLEALLVEKGLVTPEELATGKAAAPSNVQAVPADAVPPALAQGKSAEVEGPLNAGLGLGDRVRVKTSHTAGHTRAPRYCRGHVGIIDRVHGLHVFPDTASANHQTGAPLYSVKFDAAELWGPAASAGSVYIDLWEPYLEQT